MMRVILAAALLAAALLAAAPAMAQVDPNDGITAPAGTRKLVEASAQIKGAMLDSAEGWNQGSLDRFLAIYSTEPGTSFTGSKGIARGLGPIRERYIAGYPQVFGPTAGGAAPKLSFTFEDFRLLGDEHALLIARWRLETPGEEAETGMTSLVFHKEKAGWKIIADHS